MTLSKLIETQVREWMVAFDVPNDQKLQESLVVEEAIEVVEAVYNNQWTVSDIENVLKEVSDYVFVLNGLYLMKLDDGFFRTTPMLVQEMLGVVSVCLNLVDPRNDYDAQFTEAFERVVESNMSKRNDDGTVLRNENGKVMKGPNYKPPYLTDIAEQIFEARTRNTMSQAA